MIDVTNTLKARTYIENYYILDVEYISKDRITYRAEDMKYNREVWLHEYFPESIAKRYYKDDKQSTVYVDPTQSELFDAGKTEFKNLYNHLKLVNHPSIPVVYELFESCGTLFASVKHYVNTTPLEPYLNNPEQTFSEQQISMFALSIVRTFVLLQQRELQMCFLNPQTLLIDNRTQEPIVAYAEYMSFNEQSIRSSIDELGRLFYEMIDKENFKKNEPLKPLQSTNVYSAALCGLVNRMISDDASKHFKTFQELQTLFQSCEPTSELCEIKESKISSYVGLASVICIAVFIYYIFTQERIDAKKLTWFDSMRYHLVAYSGNEKGQSALGQMYEKGYYVDADIHEAIRWYTKAAKQGDVDAQLSLAYIYRNVDGAKDDKAAIETLTQLASKNNLYAQKTLGNSYMKGKGTPKDYAQAIYWFQKAQGQGDAYSCGAIGWMYASGHGVTKDLEKALEWFQKGSDRNDKYSKEELIHVKKAIKDLAEFSLQEKSLQEYKLGYQYEVSSTRSDSHQQALVHYMRSAKLGNANAEFRLAQLYERSDQIPRDYSAALYWYKKAAEHENALAYYRVSKLYRAGYGVKKDDKLALQWCQKAAERGVAVAQGIVGSCYEFGWGTGVNYSKARYWYQQAIQSGYENAVGRLAKLNQKIRVKNEVVHVSSIRKVQQRTQTAAAKNNGNTYPVNRRACLACHGVNFEKRALGKSEIVAKMRSSQIERALKGYKYGTYGGPMKGLMKGQVARYSDAAIEAFSRTIGRR